MVVSVRVRPSGRYIHFHLYNKSQAGYKNQLVSNETEAWLNKKKV
jgi:hypothetical protein